MALIIGKKETRKIRVNLDEAGDFAEVKKHTADIEFKLLKKDDIEHIQEISRVYLDETQTEKNPSYDAELALDLIFDSIVDVAGIKDDLGESIPFDESVRDYLKNTIWTTLPILQAFWSVQGGVSQNDHYKALKTKN